MMRVNWRGIKDKLILFLADKETIYAGPGVYHWLNFEDKIVVRNTQRIVGTGSWRHTYPTESYQGLLMTSPWEQVIDTINSNRAKKEAEIQALAYYEWLIPEGSPRGETAGG